MSKNVKMTNPMKVITGPNTRWSYANVWEPKSINGGTPKYKQSSRAMVNPYLLFLYLRRLFVTEILKDRTILHTLAASL